MAFLRPILLGLLIIAPVVGACSSGSSDEEVVEPGPDEILTDAATAMSDVQSASFTIEQSGALVFIDEDQFAFQSADGRFSSPSSSQAVITVDAFGFTTQVGAIAIDGELWLTNPLTGEWMEAPEGFTFDPAALFDADEGFPALLREAVGTTRLIDGSAGSDESDQDEGDDRADAADDGRNHLRTTVSAERVAVLTSGLVSEESEVDVWIDPDSKRVVEVRFDVDIDATVSSWRMTVGDYDAEVTITPPELGPEG